MDDNWDAQKMLDMYILDYMRRKNMHTTAEIFAKEANVSDKPVVINPPEGFLKEWWDMFYDVFSSTTQHGNAGAKGESSSQANMPMANVMQNVCPTIPRPGMIQMRDLIQNMNPTMPMPEMNQQQMMNPQQMMSQLMMGQFPNSSEFSMMKGEALPPSLAAATQMHEQERLMLPPRDVNIPSPLLDLEKLSRMLPSSSSSSRQKQQGPNRPPEQVGRENRRVINLGRPIPRDPTSYGIPKASRPRMDLPDAGKNKGVNLTASTGWPLIGAGSVLRSMSPHVWNQFAPTPNQQQQQFLAFASHSQDDPLSEVIAHASGKLISSASGSSGNLGNPMSVYDDSSWKDLLETVPFQQPQEQEVSASVKQAAEHMILCETEAAIQQQKDQLNEQCHNECGKDAEGEMPMNEDVEAFLSQDGEADQISTVLPHVDHLSSPCDNIEQQGFSLSEFCSLHGTVNKLLRCHFSSHGKLLACAGHERKVMLWNLETYATTIMEGDSRRITDIRFRPNSSVFATSSFDRSLQIWDSSRPSKYLFKLTGHAERVTSLDFHPNKVDLLCSCDSNDEVRLWNVSQCSCTHIFKGASKQVRFQPRLGGLLAAATGNVINLIDVETNNILFQLEGHAKDVRSICWDISGKYIASVSEDCARIWSTVLGGKCVHESHSSGNKFESCTFHPGYAQLLVIGSYQSLELWNPTERNKTWTQAAHNGLISSVEASPQTEVIASTSHDHMVKLWK